MEFTVWITERERSAGGKPDGFSPPQRSKRGCVKIARPSLDLISQVAVPFKMKLPAGTSYLKVRLTGIDFKGLELDGGRQRLVEHS
jgi:hypothetical protein